MKAEDVPPIELPPEYEARLLKFSRKKRISVDEAIVFWCQRV